MRRWRESRPLSTDSGADIWQVFQIIKQHQFRVDRGIRDANQANAKMWVPSPLRRRTRVEENRGAFPIDEWPVAVAKHDEIDLRIGRGSCGFQCCLAMMAVQEEHDARANTDPDSVRERFNEVQWIRISTYRFNRGYLFQILNHREVTNITGMQNQADACPPKEIKHWFQGPAPWCRGHMGVAKDTDENGRPNLGGALLNRQRSRPAASAHRDQSHSAR